MRRVGVWAPVVVAVLVVVVLFVPDDEDDVGVAGGTGRDTDQLDGDSTTDDTPTDDGRTDDGRADDSDIGSFTVGDCPVDPGPTDLTVTCGTFVVPARRDAPAAGTFELAVAVLQARDPSGPADPVLYLTGGPGAPAIAELPAWTTDDLLDTRDVILLDQRGTGASRPSLSCPEEDDTDDFVAAHEACRDRIEAAGIDLASLRTAETAADVAELRVALGYDSWNLWGSSYGTRVALTVLRDAPAGIRSVVLEGVYPHQVDAYADTASGDRAAIEHLFDTCAVDVACPASDVSLAAFLATVDDFEDAPVTLDDGLTYDGTDLIDAVLAGLSDSSTIAAVPDFIAEVVAGGTSSLDDVVDRLGRTRSDAVDEDSTPVFYVIECAEELALSPLADIDPDDAWDVLDIDADDTIGFHSGFTVAQMVGLCAVWDTGAAPAIEDAAVTSDVPALLLAGTFDRQTPPFWAAEAARRLSNGTLIELPHLGHDTIDIDPCTRGVFESFIDDPTVPVDASCAVGLAPAY